MAKKVPGNQKKDIEELENAFHNLSGTKKSKAGKYASKKGFGIPIFLACGIAALLVFAIVGGVIAYSSYYNNQQVTANITIAGCDITGLTRKEAESKLQEAFNSLYPGRDMTVFVEDQTAVIPYSLSQVSINAEDAVDAAISHSGAGAFDVTPYIVLNSDGVLAELRKMSPNFDSKLVQTTYSISGTVPEFIDKIDENASVVLTITKGQPGARLDIDLLYLKLLQAYGQGLYETRYVCQITDPDPIDWAEISQRHDIEPVEAEMDPETFEVSGGTYGYAFNPETAEKAVEEADYGEVITVPFEWVKPEHTAEELSSVLFRDVLANYTTYNPGSDYYRNINLKLAAEACNGIILYPGDVFSFNDTLGERTPDKGYQLGASYVGGETVYDYGGGICQVATTIYYCSVVSDLEIVERECHGYASSYTPLSTDATVFWNGIDFKFKNNTEYPIRIEASTNGGDVTVSLIGTDTKDYYVKFESEWLATFSYETVYEEMEADNEKGFKDGDVITTPYTGYKSQSFRARYSKETGELIERVLEVVDVYSSRDKVICKIVTGETEPSTDPTAPTDPTDPTDPTAPTDPTDPTDPADPTDPSESQDTPTEPESSETSTEAPSVSEETPPVE